MIKNIRKAWRAAWRVLASGTASPAQWLVDWVRQKTNDSGVEWSQTTALTYPPVWYAVNKIAGNVAQLPLVLYQRDGDVGKSKATAHPAYRLVKQHPNDFLTPSVWKETMMLHALLWGAGRSVIERTNGGVPVSVSILPPDATKTIVIHDQRENVSSKWHVWRSARTMREYPFPDRDVLHIPGLGYDGITGYSVIELAKNSWGLGLASQKAANRFFRNNAVPSLILEAPAGTFRDEAAAQEFIRRFNEYHQGLDNQGRVGLLREGIKANPLAMSGKDSQFIEQRKFQRQEAALWFLLEQILGDDASVSYNSLEQKNLAYLTNCLMRWLLKWEEECGEKLLTEREKRADSHFFKFQTAALLRGTTKERYEVYRIARTIGVLSQNECRALEDMNPVEGGDSYQNPNTTANTADNGQSRDGDDGTADGDDDDTSTANARVRQLVRAQLRDFFRVEIKTVRDAAAKRHNFLAWLDDFYGSWEARTANVFEKCGGDWRQAKDYCADSHARLVEIAGNATQDELSRCVAEGTADWLDRADEWAEKIASRN